MSSPHRIHPGGVGINKVNREEFQAARTHCCSSSRMKVRTKYSPTVVTVAMCSPHISLHARYPPHLRSMNTTPLIYPIEKSCCNFKRKRAHPPIIRLKDCRTRKIPATAATLLILNRSFSIVLPPIECLGRVEACGFLSCLLCQRVLVTLHKLKCLFVLRGRQFRQAWRSFGCGQFCQGHIQCSGVTYLKAPILFCRPFPEGRQFLLYFGRGGLFALRVRRGHLLLLRSFASLSCGILEKQECLDEHHQKGRGRIPSKPDFRLLSIVAS